MLDAAIDDNIPRGNIILSCAAVEREEGGEGGGRRRKRGVPFVPRRPSQGLDSAPARTGPSRS